MLKEVAHIGLTVSNMDNSIKFYCDVLGLKYEGELIMEGKETDLLFNKENCRVRVAYLNGGEEISAPPVELLQFLNHPVKKDKTDLFRTSISEICFRVDDIEKEYKNLVANGVECLSAPQEFDFTDSGFGKSKAIYLRDPDGNILELMEYI